MHQRYQSQRQSKTNKYKQIKGTTDIELHPFVVDENDEFDAKAYGVLELSYLLSLFLWFGDIDRLTAGIP